MIHLKLPKIFLLPQERKTLLGQCLRLIYSKSGVWPITDEELSHSTRKEVDNFWKEKYMKLGKLRLKNESVQGKNGKKYVLAMFPYPSGKLHLGHVRVYATSDAMARFFRHRGYKVIHPIGWDAFGLPAENAAIDNNEMPDLWTHTNINHMKQQLQELGCHFDWHRELATCDPDYFRWTQSLFLRLFRAGLAYQEEAQVNWDPVDLTVLANEQVDEQGYSWRSGAKVERKYLRQWYIKISRFCKTLLEGLSDPSLENWRDIIKIQQHWIGECVGYRVEMGMVRKEHQCSGTESLQSKLHLWMENPELLFGVSFIGIRSAHALNTNENKGHCYGEYQVLKVEAVCPLSKRQIPIVVSDKLPYIKDTEAYVGIPCMSQHDEDMARKCGFIIHEIFNAVVTDSGEVRKLSTEEARQRVTQRLHEENAGGYPTSAKLKDWLISRQRYWGTPIPIIHCPVCGAMPVPEEQLPVLLPHISHFPKRGVSPLKEAHAWLKCSCPRCGGEAQRETDTMDTFMDSSWYFLRFLDISNKERLFSHDLQDIFMPVDLYVGGKEHAVLHMLYARFMQHFLASEGLVSHWEPFKRLVMMGMVMGPAYRVKGTGRYLTKQQVDFSVKPPVELGTGASLVITNEKMSKSKHNGIDPKEILEEYGTDTTRLIMLSNFAPSSPRTWSNETFPGVFNWQNKLWMTVREFIQTRQNNRNHHINKISLKEKEEHEEDLRKTRNHVISNATYIMECTQQLNAAISYMQILTNRLRKVPRVMMLSETYERALAAQIIMLSPLAPHFGSELWAGFCSVANCPDTQKEVCLMDQAWPEVDQDFPLPLMYSITGEEPLKVKVPRRVLDSLTPDHALQLVLEEEKFQQNLKDRTIKETRLNIFPGLRANVFFVYKVHDVSMAKEQLKKRKEEKRKQKLEKKIKRKYKKEGKTEILHK